MDAIGAAKRYDDEHKISKQAYEGAKVGVASATKFAEEHKVAERTAAAASTAAAATSSAIKGASAMNEKYKVTETAGGMIKSGWSALTSSSTKTNSNQSSSNS